MLQHISDSILVVKLICVSDIINEPQLIDQYDFQYIIKEYQPSFLSSFYTTLPNPDVPYRLNGQTVESLQFVRMCCYQTGSSRQTCFFSESDTILAIVISGQKYALVNEFDTPEWL